ncbi:methyl-accepting chemotaxis protein [Azospirillaceae bacterium]
MSLKNTNILTRLSFGFGSLVFLTAGLGLYAFQSMTDLAGLTEKLYRHPMTVTTAALDARANIIAIHRGVKDMALAESSQEMDQIARDIDGYEQQTYDDFTLMLERFLGDKKLIQDAQQTFHDWRPVREEVFSYIRAGKKTEALAIMRGKGGTQAALAQKNIATVIDFSRNKAIAFSKAAGAQRDQITSTLLSLLGAAILIAALIAYAITRSITHPLKILQSNMKRLAEGDLASVIPFIDLTNEMGQIAQTVHVFKENAIEKRNMDATEQQRLDVEKKAVAAQAERERIIGHEIAQLITAVGSGDLSQRLDLTNKDGFLLTMSKNINALTDTIERIINDLSHVLSGLAEGDLTRRINTEYHGAFQNVKNNVNATSHKLIEMVAQINTAADALATSAGDVSAGSADLADRTEEQASSLEESAASLEELSGAVRASAESAKNASSRADQARQSGEQGAMIAASAADAMKRISDASHKITDIIGVIDEIAFQTNLLALNAAVEAARAGDAGKGFAVVAQEVRILAQRSAQASKEIKSLILSSDSEVKTGVDQVRRAGDALSGIIAIVHEVASMINVIAQTGAEQATALSEINVSIGQMEEITQKNASLVEETSAAAQTMTDMVSNLRALIGFFRIDENKVHFARAR